MATVKEMLEERTSGLRELTDRIEQELSGDADLEQLSQLADELSAKGDDFAATVTRALEALQGGEGEDGDESQGDDDEDSG